MYFEVNLLLKRVNLKDFDTSCEQLEDFQVFLLSKDEVPMNICLRILLKIDISESCFKALKAVFGC